jgi:hypothetical protein
MQAAIMHNYHIPLICIRIHTPEEWTLNRDKLGVNTTQYATEIFEPYLVPFIHSLSGHLEYYQILEDGLRVHTVKLCQEYRKAYGIARMD